MTQESGASHGPVRIELATSELDGGRFRAWADPARVLTLVAVSTPEDSFARLVEPRLRELEPAPADEGEPGGTPAALRDLMGMLRDVHARLWRENRSLMREMRTVEVSCALADEDRVYFVKGAPAWVCLLRNGQAHPVGRPPDAAGAAGMALGRNERLGLEVTSLAVRPGDTIVVFAAESDLPPDLRAVENLFSRTPDLKRACDGLVNLLGLQAQSACAVALRFVPVAAGSAGSSAANPLEDLVEAWNQEWVPGATSGATGAPASESGAPGRESQPRVMPPAAAPVSVRAAQPGSEAVEPPGLEDLLSNLDPPARSGAGTPMGAEGREPNPPEPALPEPALAGTGRYPQEDDTPRPRVGRKAWLAVLAGLLVTMGALVALPRATGRGEQVKDWVEQAWRGGGASGAVGALFAAPEPAAQGVLIDGREVAAGTPVRIDSIPAGRRRVTLDLGPCGAWEDEFTVRAGETLRVAPRLTGSVSVVAVDAAAGGRAWIQGRAKVTVPAVFDSIPAGWVRFFYEDEQIPMWDRLVLVKPGKASRLLVPNEYRGGQGAIRVEALHPEGSEGLVESAGDSVRVDGRFAGLTPLDLPVSPGLHSVSVGPVGSGAYATVLEVKAGGVRSVLARLGEGERPTLRHVAPGRVLVRGPILLSVAVSGDLAGWRAPTLHAPDLPPGSREVPLLPVEGDEAVFVATVNPELVPLGRDLRYYFTMNGPDSQTAWSDVYQLYPEAQWVGNRPAGSARWARRSGSGSEAAGSREGAEPLSTPPPDADPAPAGAESELPADD